MTIDLAPQHQAWERAEAAITITNTHRYPIVIDRVKLLVHGAPDVLDARERLALRALESESGKLSLRGTYLEDEPGPQARAPSPPRWRWAGDQEVEAIQLLPPGASRTWKASFRARESGTLRGSVAYARLDRPVTHWRVTGRKLAEPARVGGEPAFGERPVAVEVLQLEQQRGVPADPGRIDWPPPGRPAADAPAPRLVIMTPRDLAALPQALAIGEARFTVAPPAFDLASARARARVADGPYTRLVGADAWALRDGDRTALVRADSVVWVHGDPSALIEQLNDQGSARLILYTGAHKPDPHGLARWVRDRLKLKVDSVAEKGGTHGAAVTLDAGSAMSFLAGLSRWKLRIDGTRLVPR